MTGPLFPENAGDVLHSILNPEPQPGVHTFSTPPTEYDDEGEPLLPKVLPTFSTWRGAVPSRVIVDEIKDYAPPANPESPFHFVDGATLHIGDTAFPVTCAHIAVAPTLPDAPPFATTSMHAAFEAFGNVLIAVMKHLAELVDAWRLGPHGTGPCACHPAPNPAARDYRRRTKHRNRRRR